MCPLILRLILRAAMGEARRSLSIGRQWHGWLVKESHGGVGLIN